MKLIFLSNYYTHHQSRVCEEWNQLTDKEFAFVSTETFSEERKQMGWSLDCPQFVHKYSEDLQTEIEGAEWVVLGSASIDCVRKRLENEKLVFKYSERVFKKGYSYMRWLPRLYTYHHMYGKYKKLYLLAASAFTTGDFVMHGVFKGKSYRWGYFPETKYYYIEDLFSKKKPFKILWCGRFLNWKHPEIAIELAKRLKKEGIKFELDVIGDGEMYDIVHQRIRDAALQENVNLLGTMSPEQVRLHMENAGIFIFTSDFNEGWGAVLNEAMNSGCAVVASHAIGSVPFLVKHGENGLVYRYGNNEDLYRKVKTLLKNYQKQRELGERAYYTITKLWNAELAARRFMLFADEIERKGSCDLFEDGPCSRAPIIKNNWFREENYDVLWIEN